MKINIISDLHCRNKTFPPSFDPGKLESADILVVAGDLGMRPTYEKIEENKRIDVFDAAVFASIRFLIDTEKVKNADAWFGNK